MLKQSKVAIIGAGASGLTAVKCCLEEGLIPVCLERENDIGGLWNYSDQSKADKGSVYKSCVTNTSKEMFAFSDFPVPAHFPPFMQHRAVLKYLRMYADHFNLLPCIRFGVSVRLITKSEDFEQSGTWDIDLVDETGSHLERFDAVMVCTGHHVYPNIPTIQGLKNFTGKVIHSHDYKTPERFNDHKTLIIGIGNSAVDIAVDLSRVAKQVYLSTKRGAWVIGRMGPFGIPMDVLANSRFAFLFPRSWLQKMVEVYANWKIDHEAVGLSPTHRALESHPTINDELPLRIMTGSVIVKPDITSFHEKSVVFQDGIEEQVDSVILATGYDYNCKLVSKDVFNMINNKADLYKFMIPPDLDHPTLAMIGLVQPVGAFPPISEIQSRWFARLVKGTDKLPGVTTMKDDIQGKRDFVASQYYKSSKHTCETFWIKYMDEIAVQIGVKPDLLQMFYKDPCLWARCVFGPCIPAQFRLQGPGAWPGAKQAIQQAFSNNTTATKTRKTSTQKEPRHILLDLFSVAMLFGIIRLIYEIGLLL